MVEGTDGEGAIDVSRLRAETGLVAFDPGYGNTAETRSSITLLDGEAGVLRYRGYPIDQLAEQSNFLEVAYLLSYGDLPTPDGLAEWEDSITRHTLLREDMKYLFEAFLTMPIHAGARLGGVGARHVLPGRPQPTTRRRSI